MPQGTSLEREQWPGWAHPTNEAGEHRILLLDDDSDVVTTLSLMLASAGYRPEATTDPSKAVAMLRQSAYPLVFVDLVMPEKDGLQVMKEIHAIRPTTRVVIITAFADWETYVEALSSDAFDYLQKPVRQAELLSLTRRALEGGL